MKGCYNQMWVGAATKKRKVEAMRILLVEDDERLASSVMKGLREHSYAVDLAKEGEEAVYQAEVNRYDLIILDIMLPVKNGFAVCRELREKGVKTPVLMLTARGEVDDPDPAEGRGQVEVGAG